MFTIICPVCGDVKCILFDPILKDLDTKHEGITTCNNCKAKLHVYNSKSTIEVKEYENDSSN